MPLEHASRAASRTARSGCPLTCIVSVTTAMRSGYRPGDEIRRSLVRRRAARAAGRPRTRSGSMPVEQRRRAERAPPPGARARAARRRARRPRRTDAPSGCSSSAARPEARSRPAVLRVVAAPPVGEQQSVASAGRRRARPRRAPAGARRTRPRAATSVGWSGTRTSSVPNRGCGRTSHQIRV